MSITGLSDALQFGFQHSNTALHGMDQAESLVFANRNRGEILKAIIRLDSVYMMDPMSCRNLSMSLDPNLEMLPNIPVTRRPWVRGRIDHHIANIIEVTATFPIRVIGSPQWVFAMLTKPSQRGLFAATTGADMVLPVRGPTAGPAGFIPAQYCHPTMWAGLLLVARATTSSAQRLLRPTPLKRLTASTANGIRSLFCHGDISPTIGLLSIITHPALVCKREERKLS